MRNLDAHFSCQDASLVLQCFYVLHVCGQYIACYYTEHIHSRCESEGTHATHGANCTHTYMVHRAVLSICDIRKEAYARKMCALLSIDGAGDFLLLKKCRDRTLNSYSYL